MRPHSLRTRRSISSPLLIPGSASAVPRADTRGHSLWLLPRSAVDIVKLGDFPHLLPWFSVGCLPIVSEGVEEAVVLSLEPPLGLQAGTGRGFA